MTYIHSRIVPTTPCIARILDEPIELGGYRLDSGVSFNIICMNSRKYFDTTHFWRFQTIVLLHTWIAGLNDDNFKDASKCLPERWLKPMVPHSPLLVAPFGAGRRICPGKRFVELALQLILAKVRKKHMKVYVREKSWSKFFIKLHGDCSCWLIDFYLDYSGIRDRRRRRTWLAI